MSDSLDLDLPLLATGKVREIYELDQQRLLFVASDRVSTYDAVHPTLIPDKGAVLTGISAFWFEQTKPIVRNHMLSVREAIPEQVLGRSMVVSKLQMLPVECVVRGYLAGSGWSDYQANGAVCGVAIPEGLRESERLPEPIFTPATKAQVGDHDENVDFESAVHLVGNRALLEQAREVSIALYEFAAELARSRGLILADTKFEFGVDGDGHLVLADEALTPDSSRFWALDGYAPGAGQPSFDKQFVRDWASSTGWDKRPPAPEVPEQIVQQTREKYLDAYRRVTGETIAQWYERCGRV